MLLGRIRRTRRVSMIRTVRGRGFVLAADAADQHVQRVGIRIAVAGIDMLDNVG